MKDQLHPTLSLSKHLASLYFGFHEKKNPRNSSLERQKYALERTESPCQIRKGQVTVTTSTLQAFLCLGFALFSFSPGIRQHKKDSS